MFRRQFECKLSVVNSFRGESEGGSDDGYLMQEKTSTCSRKRTENSVQATRQKKPE